MADYTEVESDTIRGGVLAVASLVSRADGGFFQQFKESAAASRALQKMPPELQSIFREFDVPRVKKGEEMSTLSEAIAIVDAKDPDSSQAFRQTVIDMVEAAAEAAGGGVSDKERAIIDQVRQVVGGAEQQPTLQQQDALDRDPLRDQP